MAFLKRVYEIPFELELKVNIEEPGSIHNEGDKRRTREAIEEVTNKIHSGYSGIKLDSNLQGIPMENRGPRIFGDALVPAFINAFGNNVRPCLSILLVGLLPLPQINWYQTGELTIPADLDDLVKDVGVTQQATGGFTVIDIYRPRDADYSVSNIKR